jgi:hypothetical protein
MRHSIAFLAIAALMAACSGGNGGLEVTPQTTELQVSVEKSSYARSDLDITAGGTGVRGTIRNVGERVLYSNVGDGFNGSLDQDPVHVSNGSDGALERAEGSQWVTVAGAQMIEGTRVVAFRPGRSYTVIAYAGGAVPAGTYRLSIRVRESVDAQQPSARVSSTPFEVK